MMGLTPAQGLPVTPSSLFHCAIFARCLSAPWKNCVCIDIVITALCIVVVASATTVSEILKFGRIAERNCARIRHLINRLCACDV